MKRPRIITLLATLTGFSLIAAITASIAWFDDKKGVDQVNIRGTTEGAYFAYGDGSSGNPYGITTPRHLYNLAWLQYNGKFNKDSNNDGALDKQFYFVLDASLQSNGLDMSGWVLPPIGTETYPFLGNFNGNNVSVKNLTVSNKSDLVTPARISYSVRPEIVGFFGVVGKLNDTPSYTYVTSTNAIYNVTLNNLTVESKTNQTLIGLAGGYVNGELSGVKIDGTARLDVNGQASTAKTSITDKLTDYGLVGYTTKLGSSGNYSQDLSEYYHKGGTSGQGDQEGEGGSINAKSYMQWLFDGPRDGNAALIQGEFASGSTTENHITKTNNYEAHYTVNRKEFDPDATYLFYLFNSATDSLFFSDGTGYYQLGANRYSFTWSTHNSGVKPSGYANYRIDFASPVTISGKSYSTIYANHYNNSGTAFRLYETESGSGTTKQIANKGYSPQNCNIYRLKDNQKASSGDIHSTYIPLKFSDNNHTGVATDNTGYVVGTTLVSGANDNGVNGSPKLANYGTSFVSNSLGTTSYTEQQIVQQGLGNSTFNDSSVEIITYDTSSNAWVGIKDSHNSTFYGNATQPKNTNITSGGVSSLKTPEDLKFKKYEPYSSDPSISETAQAPLTRTSLKNIMTYEEGGVTKTNYQMSGIHFDSYKYAAENKTYGKVSNSSTGKITIPRAYLKGLASNNTNYELLKGAINFKFPSKGYVNFLAGTYYSSVGKTFDFFSIFKVNRDPSHPNQIASIYEIEEVYQRASDNYYIYKVFSIDSDGAQTGSAFYVDKDNNVVSKTNNDILVFDVKSSLKAQAPVKNALYYFELPINPGEYAMGLVVGSQKSGAYMLYLDIGANSEIEDEVSAYYTITKNTGNQYPKGVDFIATEVAGNGGESFGVYINSGNRGTIIFAVDSTNHAVAITDTPNSGNTPISAYSFRGGDYSSGSPPPASGKFTITGTIGALVGPPAGGTRVLTIHLKTVSNSEFSFRITEDLAANGSVTGTPKYEVVIGSGSNFAEDPRYDSDAEIQATSAKIVLSSLRTLTVAATLTRATGNGEFTTTYDTANCDYTGKKIDVDIDRDGTTIDIDVTTNYKLYIGGSQYLDGSTYPFS